MTFAQIASTYIAANLLIGIAFVVMVSLALLFKVTKKRLSHGADLKLHYIILTSLLGLMVIHPFLPKREIFEPMAKVWAADSGKAFLNKVDASPSGYIGFKAAKEMVPVHTASKGFMAVAILLLILGLARLVLDLGRLFYLRSRSSLIRRISDFRVYISDEVKVPFSYWLPGQKNIVLPGSLVGRPEYRMAVLHEIHHHRQGDTKWVYLIWGLRLIFIANPFIHLWNRWLSEIQEFACDEALVGQRKVESLAYASCLIEVAQAAVHKERYPVCATGLTFLVDRNTLKRRIHKMLTKNERKIGWKAAMPIGAAIIGILSVSAYASQGFVQDRRITLNQAQEIAKLAQSESNFPIVVNEKVLKWVNFFMSTPEGRERVRQALERMETFRPTIEKKLEQYNAPEELMAIPLIESGYRNLGPIHNPVGAAGLWQFIASTALKFGLRVDAVVDERLDVEKETDAAMRYLLSNKLRFSDWQLSLLSYNSGENAVQAAIDRTGSRDPWVILSSFGSEEGREYLPKFMAGLIVMKNAAAIQ